MLAGNHFELLCRAVGGNRILQPGGDRQHLEQRQPAIKARVATLTPRCLPVLYGAGPDSGREVGDGLAFLPAVRAKTTHQPLGDNEL